MGDITAPTPILSGSPAPAPVLGATDAGRDMPVSPRHHALGLDALRGLAALIVIVYHIGLLNHFPYIAPIGYLAVDFFFMLSGFVVALAYEPRLNDGRMSAGAFLKLRILRLYPAILFGVTLAIVLRLTGAIEDDALTAGALLALLMLPDFATRIFYPLNNPMWSLFYEMCANAVHPFVIRRLSGWALAAIIAIAAAAFVYYGRYEGQLNVGWGLERIGGGFIRVIYGYLFGVLVSRLTRSGTIKAHWFPGWLAPVLVLLIALPWWWILTYQGRVERILILTGCPLALLCGLNLKAPRGLTWLFRGLGTLSYPIYAIHMPLLQLAEQHLPSIWDENGGAIWTAVFAGLVVVSLVVERWWERPLRTWLRGKAPNG